MGFPEEVFLALGSNLGDRAEHLTRGLALLGRSVTIRRVSSVYESAPEGGQDQPDYLNLVVRGATRCTPRELLEEIRRVERAEGRERRVPKGPRTLDVDILFFGRRIVLEPGLTIPHPRWRERGFVLEPLTEIGAGWVDPESGLPVVQWNEVRRGPAEELRRYAPPPVRGREDPCGQGGRQR